MGLASAWQLVRTAAAADPRYGASSRSGGGNVGIISPWSGHPGHLSPIVVADLFPDAAALPVTRAEAMSVPAVAKARHVLVTHLADVPLRALRGQDELPADEQPTFLQRTDGPLSPWHRMAWTIDDLLFYGWSLWSAQRGAADQVLSADRIPFDAWGFEQDGTITVEGARVENASDVILFPGPFEGLLCTAGRTIRASRNTETAWAGRVRNPIPAVELHQVTDDVLTDAEITGLVEAYCTARTDPNGAVVYTPNAVELRTHGQASADMLIEARNAVRIDVANFTGIPGAALDGALSTASLTYVTQEGKLSELGDALRLWASPVQQRLSQDDVVPRGQRVRFDFTQELSPTPIPTGPTVED